MRILTFRRWDDLVGKLHTFGRWERPERKENAATDAVADMVRILTFRRWDDFAGKLHTFGRWERPERKENAATDAVADMARILTFRRWDDFAGKLHTFRRWERPGEGGRLLEVDVEAADPFALGSGLDDYDVTADAVLVDAVGLEEGVAVAADDDVDVLGILS